MKSVALKSAKSYLVPRVLSYPSLHSDGLEREPVNEVEQTARDNSGTAERVGLGGL